MKEKPSFIETQDLTEFEVKLFKVLREYANCNKETATTTNEEIVERIKKVFRKEVVK